MKQFYRYNAETNKKSESINEKCMLIIEINENISENFTTYLNKKYKTVLVSDSKTLTHLEKCFKKVDLEIEYKVDQEYKYDDLTDDSKLKLIESEVFLQKNLIKLKDLLGINTINDLTDDFKSTIDLEIFYKLVKIGDNQQDYNKNDIYIERTFYRFIKIDKKIFDENKHDILVIVDSEKLNKNYLKYLTFDEIGFNQSSTNEIHNIILSGNNFKNEFESLCKNDNLKNKNIHLLSYDVNGDLIWSKTFGKIELIRKFTLKYESPTNELKESFFYNLNELNEQIVIISDEAGMGKSTFIMKLSENLKFFIKIDLNKYFKELKNYQNNLQDKTYKRSIDFLCKLEIFKSNLEKKIVEQLSKNQIKLKLVVLFDGLDEISPYYKDAVIDIVDDLKQMNTKIVITTRPHLKEELENHFGVIAYHMTKFDYENQKKFLINYWRFNSEVISFVEKKVDVEKKAQDVIEKISKSINDRERDLTGIPLQLKLLSEIYLDEFDKDEELNLKLLYDKFVQKKFYEIYYKEKLNKNLDDPREKIKRDKDFEEFRKEQEHLAFTSILNNLDESNFVRGLKEEIEKSLENYKDGTNNYGFTSEVKNKNVNFIHKTFQEYFISCFLARYINEKEIEVLLVQKILIKDENKIIRLFLNAADNLAKTTINKKKPEHSALEKGLIICTSEGLNKLVKYLVENGADVNAKDKYGQTALINAVKIGNLEILKYLVENGAYVNEKDEDNQSITAGQYVDPFTGGQRYVPPTSISYGGSLVSSTVADPLTGRFR